MENKEKIIALYRYIKELCSLKYRVVTDIDKQVWTCKIKDIPDDPENISVYYRDHVEEEKSADTVLLSVKKPDFQRCPQPPVILTDWLALGWDKYINEANFKETLVEIIEPSLDGNGDENEIEHFGDSAARVKAYEKWIDARNKWVEKQHVINKTRRFFARLFQIYTDLERESESLELMVGEGLIREVGNTAINHPILLKRIKFSFDAKTNIISIHDTDTEPELYTLILQEMIDINHGVVKQLKEDLHENFYHPLDRNDAPEFLKILTHRLCSNSRFVQDQNDLVGNDDRLVTSLNAVYFVRKRIDGTLKAIEEIIENIENTGHVPGFLIDLVGGGMVEVPVDDHEHTIDEQLAALSGENPQILLSKEANREQLEIAERIEHYNAVLVQGPPGTGKTHTIANLLGHFLAQGKSVLVTSQTKKALSVLKEKVPSEIQNLCVSVLDDTNIDMVRSVDGITEYLSRYTSNELKKKIESASRQRADIIQQLAEIRKRIYNIKFREFEPIVYNGDSYSPAKAAAFVNANAEVLSYIPGKVRLNHPLPATFDELTQLYRSNVGITEVEETELEVGIPNPELLLSPLMFKSDLYRIAEHKALLEDLGAILQTTIELDFINDAIYLKNGITRIPLVQRPTLGALEQLSQYISTFKTMDSWMVFSAVDGQKGGGYKFSWEMLIESIEVTASYADSIVTQMLGHIVSIGETVDLPKLKPQLQKLQEFFQKKGKISKYDLYFNKQLETVLAQVKINNAEIASVEDCQLIQKYIQLTEKRERTAMLWNELISKHGTPDFFSLGNEPERVCLQIVPSIKRYLAWYQTEYAALRGLIKNAGFNVELIFKYSDFEPEISRIEKTLDAIQNTIPIFMQIANCYLELKEIEGRKVKALSILTAGERRNSEFCLSLIDALQNRASEDYEQRYNMLFELYAKYTLKKQREDILNIIEPIASEWACAIQKREGIHGETTCPQNIENAWKWKQFAGIIDSITAEPFEELQQKAASLSKDLRTITAKVAAHSAWYHLLRRTESNLDMKQALQGWKQTVKKIGKGTGKNAPALKGQARKLMAQCQSAVPAWIMTVSKALESLNPARNVFDVVIVDEASQSDISALAILYMAKKVIIVGDDKQVSPMAVGVDIDKMNTLCEMYIKDIIPNWHLYDAKTSLYDIAGTTFQALMLREHFRCLPDIIGYSNKLSYDYKIKPLRDANNCMVTPPVVKFRVDNGQREGVRKINSKEAEATVSLMMACMEEKEYEGMTFGIISLLGDEQSQKIQQLIYTKIEPSVIEERRILCGNASHFQGDDRNVIFISLVDSNEGDGPLNMAGEGSDQSRKQRYNVATSRAKDQLWVIHSLDYTKDLKKGDLRRDLLEYAENPKAFARLAEAISGLAESPFEESIGKSLLAAGYHLVQQWEVGAYRIDMVALCKGKCVAIECDGERFHSGDEIVRADMERQAILERLGWKFIRIRGSEYYRNPEKTIERVIQELSQMEIYPESIVDTSSNVESIGSSELLSRVKIRAAQLLDEWNTAKGILTDEDLQAADEDTSIAIEFKKPPAHLPSSFVQHNRTIITQMTLEQIDNKPLERTRSVKEQSQMHTYIRPSKPSLPVSAVPAPVYKSPQARPNRLQLIEKLTSAGITFIDRREQSGIIWVLYSEETHNKLEPILKETRVSCFLERRGSTSTGNKPAWRIMVN